MSRAQDVVTNLLKFADVRINGARLWDIQVHNPRFFSRVLASGTLGFGESYMDGWWDCDALDEMCCRAIRAGLEKRFRISTSQHPGLSHRGSRHPANFPAFPNSRPRALRSEQRFFSKQCSINEPTNFLPVLSAR
jgi:hypothetical protein